MKSNLPSTLSDGELEAIAAIVADSEALAVLSKTELIHLVLESELGDNLLVIELLNRIDPNWCEE